MLGVQEFSTPDVVTAADLPSGSELLFIALDMTNAVRTNPSTFVALRFFTSRNDGVSWQPVAGITFRGDPSLPNTAPIGVGIGAASLIGARVKAQVECPSPTSVGLSVSVASALDHGLVI